MNPSHAGPSTRHGRSASALEPRYCVLATVSRDGHPVARPVSFVTLGAGLWFATVAGARLRHLTRTPWASVVIEDGAPSAHRAVAIDGPVTIHRDPPAEVPAAWSTRDGSSAEWASAWCELRPARLLSYSAARAAHGARAG